MSSLTVEPLSPGFGVRVAGVVPRLPLDPVVLAELRGLLDAHGLLVLRDIDADNAFQHALSQALVGEPAEPPAREMLVSNKAENGGAPFGRLLFHSDRMWSPQVFRLLSLYGLDVAQPAIPTIFVSAARAWETLPDDLRAAVAGRRAAHGQQTIARGGDDDVLLSTFAEEETVALPIGFAHPRTGRTLLYVSEMFTRGIEGLPADESEALLQRLFDHLYAADDAIVAHEWRTGDLVLWDNIALQHARPNVRREGPPRTLRKVFAPPARMSPAARPVFRKVGEPAAA